MVFSQICLALKSINNVSVSVKSFTGTFTFIADLHSYVDISNSIVSGLNLSEPKDLERAKMLKAQMLNILDNIDNKKIVFKNGVGIRTKTK